MEIEFRLIRADELPKLLELYKHLNSDEPPLLADAIEETLRFYEKAGFQRGIKTGFVAKPD